MLARHNFGLTMLSDIHGGILFQLADMFGGLIHD